MLLKKHPVSSIAVLSALMFAQNVLAADTFTGALTGGKANVDLRYRYEDVRNASTPAPGTNTNTATANTARLRVGYTTDTFYGFGAMVEGESTVDLGNRQYNGGNNGNFNRANILDPEITEINQAYLSFSGLSDTTMKFGRQRVSLDNHRFIGNVGWRQNEQTFDAFTLVNKSLPSTTATLGYLMNANRIVGDNVTTAAGVITDAGNAHMKSPIVNLNYKGFSFAEITAYAYLLDYDPIGVAKLGSNTTNDSSANTYGLRFNGSAAMGDNKLLYTVEFAEQRDGSNNSKSFKDTYTLLEGGVDWTNVGVFKLGYEVLGTDLGARAKVGGAISSRSFQTPLATLHAFNGWADMFLTTPSQGLKDTYLKANTKLAGINLGMEIHDYRADKTTAVLSSGRLGDEWGAVATYTFEKIYTVGFKYADYRATGTPAKTFATNFNTKKTWFWGEVKF